MKKGFVKLEWLGELEIINIYVYYDQPWIFSCKDKNEQLYFCLCADEDERGQRWLYLPVSKHKLFEIESGSISIYSAFKSANVKYVFNVYISFDNELDEISLIKPSDIEDDCLPDKDIKLSFIDPYDVNYFNHVQNKVKLQKIEYDPLELSLMTRRDVLDLCFEPQETHHPEIDCDSLGISLITTQAIINSISYNKINPKGRIPNEFKLKNKLNVAATRAASFGVILLSNETANLMGSTPVSEAIQIFSKLLEAKDNEQLLNDICELIPPRAFYQYVNLLKALLNSNTNLQLKTATPDRFYKHVKLTQESMSSTLNIIENKYKTFVTKKEMLGELVGYNVKKNTFALLDLEQNLYTGSLSSNLKGATLTIPSSVKVIIQESIDINPLTQKEKYTYELIEIIDILGNK